MLRRPPERREHDDLSRGAGHPTNGGAGAAGQGTADAGRGDPTGNAAAGRAAAGRGAAIAEDWIMVDIDMMD